jgi:hypothetical protein
MRVIFSLAVFWALALSAPTLATQVPDDPNGSNPEAWTCRITRNGGGERVRTCTCSGLQDCADMSSSSDCTSDHTTRPCDVTGCICTGPARDMSPAPNLSEHDPNLGVAPTTDEERRNETVPSQRSTPQSGSNRSDDIIAPNNVTPAAEDTRRDHRRRPFEDVRDGTSNTVTFDEADALFRQGARPQEVGRNEIVTSQRGTMTAPSHLSLLDVQRTSLTLQWHDNTRWEYGVAVERGTPTSERGGTNYHWRQVFNVEERVGSRVDGTGMRSDSDDGLSPATTYCYRLRAYREGQFSAYSDPACAQTQP